MTRLLVMLPFVGGVVALLPRDAWVRRGVVLVVAVLHAGMTAWCIVMRPAVRAGAWLGFDEAGLLVLGLSSALFLAVSIYAVVYLQRQQIPGLHVHEHNESERVFCSCLLAFLGTMTVVSASRHLGLLWVAMEATTLASAPLIYFHRTQRSLEATWKYVLICSVGIALALLGTVFLAAGVPVHASPADLTMERLLATGGDVHVEWLRISFICFAVGYGTKMGLAPLHTWLPDAHSEAPSLVSALLSGALLNCAGLGVLRAHQVCVARGMGALSGDILVVLGIASVIVAAVFIIGQSDYKRMLAYSSVEHMGIVMLGVGLGGGAVFGALLHAVNHSLTKAALFMAAGTILETYRSKQVRDVRGLRRRLPWTAVIWLAGFFAITGTPPFGLFISEFTIATRAIEAGRWVITVLYLGGLAAIFAGMGKIVIEMVSGTGGTDSAYERVHEPGALVVPSLALLSVTLLLGLYVPAGVGELLRRAATAIGGLQ